MKPDWDKLMKFWNKGERSKSTLIADVDCTAGGKKMCTQMGVTGYPTIKWGEASELEDYKGGRDYKSLKQFATENLKPSCSPANLQTCDDEQKKEIAMFQDMPAEELKFMISEKRATIRKAEVAFKEEARKIEAMHAQLAKERDEAISKLKWYGIMAQTIQEWAKKPAENKDEL